MHIQALLDFTVIKTLPLNNQWMLGPLEFMVLNDKQT